MMLARIQQPLCVLQNEGSENWHFAKSWTTDATYVTSAVNTQTLRAPSPLSNDTLW